MFSFFARRGNGCIFHLIPSATMPVAMLAMITKEVLATDCFTMTASNSRRSTIIFLRRNSVFIVLSINFSWVQKARW